MFERGWLKTVLEDAVADRETWPAWQRGLEPDASESNMGARISELPPLPERGWLRVVLEQAVADREKWPAWQRGLEPAVGRDLEAAAKSEISDEQENPAA